MQIHFIRNATLILDTGLQRVLVDPMLGPKGSLPPFAFWRHRPRRNPTVSLPSNAESAFRTITAALITHCRRGHYDHLDRVGWSYLAGQKTPVYCNHLDEKYLHRRGMVTIPLRPKEPHDFLHGRLTPFVTQHGYGLVGRLMGPGVGFFLALPDEPTLYISGDTVLTAVVKQVLLELRPDITILAAGGASLDIGEPILMPMAEVLECIRLSPGIVIATHLEALNHCPVTRSQLRQQVIEADLAHKVYIPEDGEILNF